MYQEDIKRTSSDKLHCATYPPVLVEKSGVFCKDRKDKEKSCIANCQVMIQFIYKRVFSERTTPHYN